MKVWFNWNHDVVMDIVLIVEVIIATMTMERV